jgi:small-conductance mechanosensitive channel
MRSYNSSKRLKPALAHDEFGTQGSGQPCCGLSLREACPLSYIVPLYYIPPSTPTTIRHVETHVKLTAFPLRLSRLQRPVFSLACETILIQVMLVSPPRLRSIASLCGLCLRVGICLLILPHYREEAVSWYCVPWALRPVRHLRMAKCTCTLQ